jgi:hypothetical protein
LPFVVIPISTHPIVQQQGGGGGEGRRMYFHLTGYFRPGPEMRGKTARTKNVGRTDSESCYEINGTGERVLMRISISQKNVDLNKTVVREVLDL